MTMESRQLYNDQQKCQQKQRHYHHRRRRRCLWQHQQVIIFMMIFLSCYNLLLSSCNAFLPTLKNNIKNSFTFFDKRTINHNKATTSNLIHYAVPTTTSSSSSSSSQNYDTIQSMKQSKSLERKIVQLGRSGKTNDAIALYESIKHPTTRLMNAAIDACARARPTRLDQAFEILATSQSESCKPNVFTFGPLMSACARARDAKRAIQLLRSMKKKYNVEPNAVVYSAAISACARSEPPQPETALQLLKEAVEDKELPMNVIGYNAAISACANVGDWRNAIHLVDRMQQAQSNNTSELSRRVPTPDAITYGTVLSACEKGQQWELVLQYAGQLQQQQEQQRRQWQKENDNEQQNNNNGRDRNKNFNNNLDGLAIMSCLHACQQLGYAKEAIYYLSILKSLNNDTSQKQQRQRRQTNGWERLGARGPLMGPDAVAYRLAISACARGGAWQEGIQLLNEFESATGTPPNVVAYTAAITGCEYAGEWRYALKLLNIMRTNNVNPNEVTMAAIIGACATACAMEAKKLQAEEDMSVEDLELHTFEPHEKAMLLLDIMKKQHESNNSTALVEPNIQVYNAAIRTCAEAHDIKSAFKLLDEIRNNPSLNLTCTLITYGSLMTACERVGNVDGASKVFRFMREQQEVDPSIVPNEIIYGAAISCCRKAKEADRAVFLLRRMIQEGLKPNVATFNTVLMAQTETANAAKNQENAILIYKIMKSQKYGHDKARPNRQTYNVLIRYLAMTCGEPAAAEQFLKYMNSEANMKPDVDLYTMTVTAYERKGQPLKALRLMESMQQDGYDFYSVSVLNAAFKKALKFANVVGRGLDKDGNSINNTTDTPLSELQFTSLNKTDTNTTQGGEMFI